jgi:prepilin-type N-terminal cleavage/methylation domain-containing protein
MQAPNRVQRGVTLIELLVSVAVLSIVLTAVMSVVVAIARQRRESTNMVEVRANARVALSMMQFDASNAGFRFGAAPFAVRVLQNVTGGETELADTVDCGGRAGWVVMPGTDVIEFREGRNGVSVGKVPQGNCGTPPLLSCFNGGGLPNPFDSQLDGTSNVVFFSSSVTACAARLNTTVGGGNFTLLTQSLRSNATPGVTYLSVLGPGQCPAPDMTITALGQVTRYLVCRPPVFDQNTRPALFRQRWGPTYPLAGSQIDFVSVQDSVEDLQVATMLGLSTNPGMVTGATCQGTGLSENCWCGLLVAGDCSQYVPDPTAVSGTLNGASTLASERSAFLARSFRVSVTTLSSTTRGFGDQALFVRPAVYNRPVGLVTDYGGAYSGRHRTVLESTITPQNIVLVNP